MTINERVKAILSVSKAARNSDKELWLIYAQKSGVELSEAQMDKIRDMPEFETLRRVRQKTQQLGYYRADEVVAAARKQKAYAVHQGIPFMDSEQISQELETLTIVDKHGVKRDTDGWPVNQ